MFFAPLRPITPGISMLLCREEILSPNQPFLFLLPTLLNAYVRIFDSVRTVHNVIHVVHSVAWATLGISRKLTQLYFNTFYC